jgi:hypothetical protein
MCHITESLPRICASSRLFVLTLAVMVWPILVQAQDPAAIARRDSAQRAVANRAAQLDAAAKRFLDRSLSPADRLSAVRGIHGLVKPGQADSALAIAFDGGEPAEVRAVALKLGSIALVEDSVSRPRLVGLVGDRSVPIEVRRAGLRTLDALLTARPVSGSDSLLRVLVSDPDDTLRTSAIGRLAADGDRAIRGRLIQGLRDPSQALLPPGDALEMLAARPTPEVAAAARSFVSSAQPLRVRLIAVRLAAMDSLGRDSVAALIQDDASPVDLRITAGRALALNRPARFSQVSTPIITNEQANPALRAELIRALSVRGSVVSPALAQQVEQLSTQSTSPAVRSAATKFREAREEKRLIE